MQWGDPMEMNFEVLKRQKWNKPADSAERTDEKNGVIFLFIMFTPRATVNKISKMAYFLYFLLMAVRNQ